MRALDRRRLSPIRQDLTPGRGGIAGGLFTMNSSDSLNPVTYQYVAPGYVTGQGGYIFGDLGNG